MAFQTDQSQTYKSTPGFYRYQWLIAALLVCLLHGCGTAPQVAQPAPTPEKVYKNPEDNPQYWYQRTQEESSSTGKYITYKTQSITENWPGESLRWSLRSIAPAQNTSQTPITDQIVHQLYFHIRYKGDVRDYYRAEMDRVVPKRINGLAKDTGSCQYGCIFSEDFTVTLTTEELEALASREETKISLIGSDGTDGGEHPTLMLLPGPYLKGHLQKLLENPLK